MKNKFSRYNDGIVNIYREKQRRTDFAAKYNPTTLEDFEFVAKLDFEESAKREQDMEFAERQSFSLTLKIKTRNLQCVDSGCKAIINDYLYSVSYVDRTKTEMFLFLEGVRALD